MLSLLRRITPLAVFTVALLSAPNAASAPTQPQLATPARVSFVPLLTHAIAEPTTRFAVIGDYGADSQAESDVALLVKRWQPQFIVTVGDNNYPAGAAATIDHNIGKYYQAFIAPYRGSYGRGATDNHFFPTLGNHDWDASGAKPYLDYFTLPGNERYYDVAVGNVHLFALDSDDHEPDGITATSTQGKWLQARLGASRSCWDLVVMHHPPYSSGLPGGSEKLQWPYRTWGADAVLAGHVHVYERLVVDRTLYFVNGVGGEELHQFGTIAAGSQMRYNSDFGAMLIEATSTQISFSFYSRTGQFIDTAGLRKSCK